MKHRRLSREDRASKRAAQSDRLQKLAAAKARRSVSAVPPIVLIVAAAALPIIGGFVAADEYPSGNYGPRGTVESIYHEAVTANKREDIQNRFTFAALAVGLGGSIWLGVLVIKNLRAWRLRVSDQPPETRPRFRKRRIAVVLVLVVGLGASALMYLSSGDNSRDQRFEDYRLNQERQQQSLEEYQRQHPDGFRTSPMSTDSDAIPK